MCLDPYSNVSSFSECLGYLIKAIVEREKLGNLSSEPSGNWLQRCYRFPCGQKWTVTIKRDV